jgi:hypothetical protein
MSSRGHLAAGVIVVLCLPVLTGMLACTSSTSSPPPVPDAGMEEDVTDSGPMEPSDVLTPEGCMQGQTCECVGLASACMGGPPAKSCVMQVECEPSVTQVDMLCLIPDGGTMGTCAKRCAKNGGCTPPGMSSVMCPLGYVCEQAPIGPNYPVCIVPNALMPPNCTIQADCTNMIPGGKCTAQGCLLPCTN